MFLKTLAGLTAALMISAGATAALADTNLVIYHSWSTPSEMAALDVLKGKLKSQGIGWTEIAIPHDTGANVSLTNMVTGGNPPDVFMNSDPGIIRDLEKQGLTMDLTKFFADNGVTPHFPEAVVRSITVDGKIMKIPTGIHIDGMVYWNMDVAKKAGVDPTKWTSLDDMWADLPKVKAAGYIPLAIGSDAFQVGYLTHALIAAMTTNVTRFFREPHHFEHLTDVAMPLLADAARRGGKVRIWSAGCSSGEEPYSIALTVLKAMPDAAEHDILVLASDIDPDMIARAEAGAYPSARLADIPPQMRGTAVETARSGGELQFRLTEKVQKLVRFRQLNLLREWPMRGQFNIIFCRNVMIYFDQQTQDSIWSRFARQMSPGGYLYIGHSERIATESLPFELAGQTTYRLKGEHR